MSHKKRTLQILDELDRQSHALEKRMSSFSNDDLNKAENGQWSALQILHHLIASERLSLAYIRKKLSFNPKLKSIGLNTQIRSLLLKGYLKAPVKFKAPKMVGVSALPDKSSYTETFKRWKETRIEMRSFLESLPEERFNEEVYKHPVSGRLGLDGMLTFFNKHTERHEKQLARIFKKRGF